MSVLTSITTNELNSLVNELLKGKSNILILYVSILWYIYCKINFFPFLESHQLEKEIDFDFLISSQFLRSTLSEHIFEKNLSIEQVIDIEYIEKHQPPEPQNCLIHDDWVSAVAVCQKWLI